MTALTSKKIKIRFVVFFLLSWGKEIQLISVKLTFEHYLILNRRKGHRNPHSSLFISRDKDENSCFAAIMDFTTKPDVVFKKEEHESNIQLSTLYRLSFSNFKFLCYLVLPTDSFKISKGHIAKKKNQNNSWNNHNFKKNQHFKKHVRWVFALRLFHEKKFRILGQKRWPAGNGCKEWQTERESGNRGPIKIKGSSIFWFPWLWSRSN